MHKCEIFRFRMIRPRDKRKRGLLAPCLQKKSLNSGGPIVALIRDENFDKNDHRNLSLSTHLRVGSVVGVHKCEIFRFRMIRPRDKRKGGLLAPCLQKSP